MSFKKWLDEYEKEYDNELMKWMQKSGKQTKDGKPVILPSGLEEYTLAQYTAYRADLTTKRLVWATWVLAMSTIVLSIITLVMK